MYDVKLVDAEDWEILEAVVDRNLDVSRAGLFWASESDLTSELRSRGVWMTLDRDVIDLAERVRQRINMGVCVGNLMNHLIEELTGRLVCK